MVVAAAACAVTGHSLIVLVAAGMALAILVAYRMPLFTLALLVAIVVGPQLFQMTPHFRQGAFTVARVPAESLVLIPMTGALVARLLVRLSGRQAVLERDGFRGARLLMSALLMWLAFEVGREVGPYGLSSVKEFANENFLVVCPLYIATFFRSQRQILGAFKVVGVFALVAPIVLIPVIGSLKGWGIGPNQRFYPAEVHLGLLFGVLSLALLKRHAQIRVGWWALYLAATAATLLIIVDSHRSVWLSCATAVVVLVLLGEIRLQRFWHWGFVVLAFAAVAVLVLSLRGLDVPHYISTRASAFLSPSSDPTSDWRLSIWRQALPIARAHLVAGQGYGSYFSWVLNGGQVLSVQPHDTYIQLLLKTGAVGTALAVAVGLATLRGLRRNWKVVRDRRNSWTLPVIVTGIAALAVIFAWGLVYGMALYPFVFVGLGVAAALRVSSRPNEPPDAIPNAP